MLLHGRLVTVRSSKAGLHLVAVKAWSSYRVRLSVSATSASVDLSVLGSRFMDSAAASSAASRRRSSGSDGIGAMSTMAATKGVSDGRSITSEPWCSTRGPRLVRSRRCAEPHSLRPLRSTMSWRPGTAKHQRSLGRAPGGGPCYIVVIRYQHGSPREPDPPVIDRLMGQFRDAIKPTLRQRHDVHALDHGEQPRPLSAR